MAGNRVTIVIDSDGRAFVEGVEDAGRGLDRLGRKSEFNARKMKVQLLAVTAALGTVAYATYKAVKAAEDLNRAMANVATLIPGNSARIRELRNDVQQLAMALGTSTDDLSGGLYQVISAFGDAADSTEKLRITAMAAKAGLATTTESLNLLSAVTKGYGDTSAEALEKVSDLAFTTVKLGQTTFPELAASMGRVVPVAATLKVSQEELFAGFATLTGVTGTAAEVSTQLAGVLRAMIKPTEEMAGAIEKLGYSGAEAMLSELGLVESLKALISTTDGSTEAVGDLFGRAEALTSVFALTGAQADTFNEKLREMETASGATAEAFREQTEGINEFEFKVAQLEQTWVVFFQKLGDFITQHPAVIAAIDDITNALKGFAQIVGIDLRDEKEQLADYTKQLEDYKNIQALLLKQKEEEERRLTAGVTSQLEMNRRIQEGSRWLRQINENLTTNAERIATVKSRLVELRREAEKGEESGTTPTGGIVPDTSRAVGRLVDSALKLTEDGFKASPPSLTLPLSLNWTQLSGVSEMSAEIEKALDETQALLQERQAQAVEAFDSQLTSYQGYFSALVDLHRNTNDEIVEQELRKWQTVTWLAQGGFGMMSDMMQNLTVLTGKEGGAAFKAMKAFAVAQTAIDTYRAAQGAYAALAGIPIVGPALGTAAAAAAMVAGLARVKQIQGMEPGGTAVGASISAGGVANPSYSGGSTEAYPVPQRAEESREPKTVNYIYINGNLVDHSEFAREMAPYMKEAAEDKVDFGFASVAR